MVKIASGNFTHFILRPHDDRKLFRVMVFAPSPIANERGEEAGEPVGLIGPRGFEVTAKRLRPHVDTVN
jgi:hypothetical protein